MAPTIIMHSGFEQGVDADIVETGYRSLNARTGRFAAGFDVSTGRKLSWVKLQSAHGVTTKHAVVRFYLYVETLPGGGNGKMGIYAWSNYHEGGSSLYLVLDSDGKLSLWNVGNQNPVLGAISTQRVYPGQWYRIDMGVQMNTRTSQPPPNPPYDSDAKGILNVNGLRWATYSDTSPSTGSGIHDYNALAAIDGFDGIGILPITSYFTATTGSWLVDDLAIGVGESYRDLIGEGRTISLTGTGPGALVGWGLTPTTAEGVMATTNQEFHYLTLASSTALDQFTVALPTLASQGVPATAKITNAQVHIAGAGAGWTGRAILTVNGVANYGAVTVPVGSYGTAYFPSVVLHVGDVIEIGLEKDDTATARAAGHLHLTVNVDQLSPAARGYDVQVKTGSYVGNGTSQEIVLGFQPDLLWIVPSAGTLWDQLFIVRTPTGGYSPVMAWTYGVLNQGRLARMTATGVVVTGLQINNAATTYFVVAIKDPSYRLVRIASSVRGANAAAPKVAPWAYTSIATKPPYVMGLFTSPDSTSYGAERLPHHAYDQCHQVNQAIVAGNQTANFLVDHDASGVTLGNGMASVMNVVLGWNPSAFIGNTLCAVFSYTGNDVVGRTISLPASMASKTPVLLMTMPPDGGTSDGFDHLWTAAMAPGRCLRKYQVALSAPGKGITGVSAGGFTVDASANRAGVVYYAFALAEGSDAVPTTTGQFEASPGTWEGEPFDWMLEWPDAVPGLLGVKLGNQRYVAPPLVTDALTWDVGCDQRQFPVDDTGAPEFDVPAENREFTTE